MKEFKETKISNITFNIFILSFIFALIFLFLSIWFINMSIMFFISFLLCFVFSIITNVTSKRKKYSNYIINYLNTDSYDLKELEAILSNFENTCIKDNMYIFTNNINEIKILHNNLIEKIKIIKHINNENNNKNYNINN